MDVLTRIPTLFGEWPEKFGATWDKQIEGLKATFGEDGIEEVRMPGAYPTDVPVVYVRRERIVDVLSYLKTAPGCEYEFLSDLTATDETPAEPRFEVVYQLFSPSNAWRIRVKVRVREGESVPTATVVWPAANWAEREVWDMFGVRFEGHPGLRRILMDQRWVGHPLRKDYPLRGYQIFPDPEPIDPELLK